MLDITDSIQIPSAELDFSFARSGGPGGQNVNKVNSKAILRWPATTSSALPEGVKQRFLNKFASKLTLDGDLIVTSQRFRDQNKNIDACLEKLRLMVVSVIDPPTPRRPTKPSRAAKERRVDSKKVAGQKKQSRRKPRYDD